MNSKTLKKRIQDWNSSYSEEYRNIAEDIWKHPELSLQEFYCSNIIIEKLKTEGFTVKEGIGGMPTAFIAEYSHGSGKPVLGFNCEYDSLPGLSQSCELTSKSPITEGAPG